MASTMRTSRPQLRKLVQPPTSKLAGLRDEPGRPNKRRPAIAAGYCRRKSEVCVIPFRMAEKARRRFDLPEGPKPAHIPIELELFAAVYQRHLVRQRVFGEPTLQPSTTRDSYSTFHSFSNGVTYQLEHPINPHLSDSIDWSDLPREFRKNFQTADQVACSEIQKSTTNTVEPTLDLAELNPELRAVFERSSCSDSFDLDAPCFRTDTLPRHHTNPSKRSLRRQVRIAHKKEIRRTAKDQNKLDRLRLQTGEGEGGQAQLTEFAIVMTSAIPTTPPPVEDNAPSTPAQHKPLVVGRTKPRPTSTSSMEPAEVKAALNHEIEKNVQNNTVAAAPAEETASLPTKKKEKAPKQPKAPKATPPSAPLSPALIDLRVGHILRAICHPNADSLFVSTIAMGDPEGTEHTEVDEETGKVVRTVCSGLNGLVPLEEMQDRKVVVVANLKPVNMRSIKSAAMVLAASPPAEEGADPHAADRIVELVNPPEGAEAGEKVYFEGWPYGDGKGPEKQLNPKKKQWEAIQPGFYTTQELVVGFDASKSEMQGASEKGNLIVEGKGRCTVKTLKGAVVR